MLLTVIHRISHIHTLHHPTIHTKRLLNHPAKVTIIHRIVRPQSRRVIIKHHLTILPQTVILRKIPTQLHQLTLILHPKSLHRVHPPPSFIRLTHHKPVNVPVKVKSNTQRSIPHQVSIHLHTPSTHLRPAKVILQIVQIVKIRSRVQMTLLHRTVKTIPQLTHRQTQHRRQKHQRRQITLHLPNITLTQHLQIRQTRIHTIIQSVLPEPRQLTLHHPQTTLQIPRSITSAQTSHNQLTLTLQTHNHLDQLTVHLTLIVHKPRPRLRRRHIRRHQHPVMKRTMPKLHLLTTIRQKRLILQLLKLHKLTFINRQEVKTLRVRRTLTILRHNLAHRTIVKPNHIVPTIRLIQRTIPTQSTRRPVPNAPMHIPLIPPSLPMHRHRRQSVRQSTHSTRRHYPHRATRHLLQSIQQHRSLNHTLTRTTTRHHHIVTGTNRQHLTLHPVHIHFHR